MAAAVAWNHCAAGAHLSRGCPTDPAARRIYGCDGGGEPGYGLTCWLCWRTRDPECRLCGGSGEIWVHDCPRRAVTPEVAAMHAAYQCYRDGFLPVFGGMADQSATFAQGARLLGVLYALHEAVEMKRKGR